MNNWWFELLITVWVDFFNDLLANVITGLLGL